MASPAGPASGAGLEAASCIRRCRGRASRESASVEPGVRLRAIRRVHARCAAKSGLALRKTMV